MTPGGGSGPRGCRMAVTWFAITLSHVSCDQCVCRGQKKIESALRGVVWSWVVNLHGGDLPELANIRRVSVVHTPQPPAARPAMQLAWSAAPWKSACRVPKH